MERISQLGVTTQVDNTKGVVGAVYPDEWMPVDEYGERAEVWIDSSSPVARNNPGQLFETGINRISEFARRKIQETYTTHGTDAAFDQLTDWMNDVNPNYAALVREACPDTRERKPIVVDALENGIKLCIPPFLDTLCPTDDEQWNGLINMRNWANKWGCRPSRITFTSLQADGTGKQFVSEMPFSIGSKYYIPLNKIPEIAASGPASVSHIGIPTKSTYENKNYPVSVSPYRFGEDELRMMLLGCDPREVVRFQGLMSNSPIGVMTLIKALMVEDKPTDIPRVGISNGDLLETSAVLNLFHSVSGALGVETKTTLTTMSEIDDELTEAIWKTDVGENVKDGVGSGDEDRPKKRTARRPQKVKQILDAVIADVIEELQEEEDAEAEADSVGDDEESVLEEED